MATPGPLSACGRPAPSTAPGKRPSPEWPRPHRRPCGPALQGLSLGFPCPSWACGPAQRPHRAVQRTVASSAAVKSDSVGPPPPFCFVRLFWGFPEAPHDFWGDFPVLSKVAPGVWEACGRVAERGPGLGAGGAAPGSPPACGQPCPSHWGARTRGPRPTLTHVFLLLSSLLFLLLLRLIYAESRQRARSHHLELQLKDI